MSSLVNSENYDGGPVSRVTEGSVVANNRFSYLWFEKLGHGLVMLFLNSYNGGNTTSIDYK